MSKHQPPSEEAQHRYGVDCLYTPPDAFAVLNPDTRTFLLDFGGVEAFPERREQYAAAGLPFPESPAEYLARVLGKPSI